MFKISNKFERKRHAIAHKVFIDQFNRQLVHHLNVYECDPNKEFDDNHLPDGLCEAVMPQLTSCMNNIAVSWGVGGEEAIEYPDEAGFPIGGDFNTKYYLIKVHYENPSLEKNRSDSSGVRFYLGHQLRQYDIGYLGLGTDTSAYALAIPPRADHFAIDSYCPSNATRRFPQSGITVFSTFPHTHVQGRSLWTKLIRNRTAIQYVFHSEVFNFNFQFHHRLSKRIQLYPGDELATRCVYSTKDKNEITLGGERTQDEICFHGLFYYPRVHDLNRCVTYNELSTWRTFMNFTGDNFDYHTFKDILLNMKWSPELTAKWQTFYDHAARQVIYSGKDHIEIASPIVLPKYEDLKLSQCNFSVRQQTFISLLFVVFVIQKIFKVAQVST